MTIQTDVLGARRTSSGTYVDQGTRVKAIHAVATGSAGTVELIDGGASGTSKFTVDVPANGFIYILLPGEGVRFRVDVYGALTNIAGATVFYG